MKIQRYLILILTFFSAFLSGCATISIPKYYSVELKNAGIKFYILNGEINPNRTYPVLMSLAGSEVSSQVWKKEGTFGIKLGANLALKHLGYFNFDYLTAIPEKRNISERYLPGNKVSEKFHETNTLEQRVKDTEAVLSYVLENYNIDKTKVVLVGSSEGGAVATIVARNNNTITHLILRSSGGWSHEDAIRYGIEHLELDKWSRDRKELQSIDAFDKFLSKLKSTPHSLDKWWGGWPYKRWASYMFYRPMDDLRMLNIPILIQMGDKNYHPALEGTMDVKRVFDKLGKSNLTLKIYSGLDHVFKNDEEVSHAKEIFDDMYQWLEEN